MIKNLTQLEVKVGEKIYHFLCDQDSPLQHAKEALFQFLKYPGQVEDAAKNLTQLEVKVGEKIYHFLCDQDSPLENAKEAVFQFLKYAGQVEDAAKAAQQAASQQPADPEVKKDPPQEEKQDVSECKS